jgi:hypothetical protein
MGRFPAVTGLALFGMLGCIGAADLSARRVGHDASLPDAATAEVHPTASAEVMAGRLARLLWNVDPDAALTARLAAEPLTTARLTVVAEEMLSDPRARNGIRAFFRWWLLLDPLPSLDKEDPDGVLDPSLRRSMTEEAPALGVHLTLETRGTFADLLTAPFTFMDERLARHYGVAGVEGPAFRRVTYPAGQHRIGVMTGAGVLALFSSLSNPSWPAKRSWLVTDPFLCVVPIRSFLPLPAADPNRSIRQQMIAITDSPGCMVCHKYLNSPGFAFIGFDSFGRWRPAPGHGPGETAGWIPREILADEPRFDGPEELARLLASRPEASRCFASHWLRFAVDREGAAGGPVPPPLESSLAEVHAAFAASGLQLRALVTAIVRTHAFAAAPP